MRRCSFIGLVGSLWASAATALPVDQCVAKSSEGQEQQRAGHLRAARAALLACSDETCPDVVRGDCTRWLADVVASTPNVVVAVRVDGVDRMPEQVLLDGQQWIDHLSGTPVDVEPGEHRLGVRVDGRLTEQKLLFNIGEKNRLIVFQLGPPPPPVVIVAPAPAPVVVVGAPVRSAPWLPLSATAATIAGAGLFVGFGMSGKAQLATLVADPCAAAKTCDPARVADVERRFVAADVSLGVGMLAALVAGWQWWSWAAEPPSVAGVLTPIAGGAVVSVGGAF